MRVSTQLLALTGAFLLFTVAFAGTRMMGYSVLSSLPLASGVFLLGAYGIKGRLDRLADALAE